MTIKTSWDRNDVVANRRYYVSVEPSAVVVGEQGGSSFDGGAGSCTHEEFLAGQFHDLIARDHGPEVLAEVIEAVRSASEHAPFRAYHDDIARLRAYLDTIPLAAALRGFHERPRVENGGTNYGNGGGYKTILRAGTVTLTANLDGSGILSRAEITNDDGTRGRSLNLGFVDHSVACRDHFYLCMSQSFAVLDADGQLHRRERDARMFGEKLRISGVYRHEDDVCFRAAWFSNNYPDVLLRCSASGELIARWEPV